MKEKIAVAARELKKGDLVDGQEVAQVSTAAIDDMRLVSFAVEDNGNVVWRIPAYANIVVERERKPKEVVVRASEIVRGDILKNWNRCEARYITELSDGRTQLECRGSVMIRLHSSELVTVLR